MRASFAVASALLALALLQPALADEESAKALSEGETHYQNKEYKEALACFERAIKTDPKNAKAHAYRGGALVLLGDAKAGFEAYDKALELDQPPGRITVWVHQEKGLYYGEKNELDRSVTEFKKALDLAPEDDFLWRNLGVSYARQKKFQLAVDAFEKSLESNPDQPQVKAWIAEARRQGGLGPAPKKEKPEKPERPEEKPEKPAAVEGGARGDASFELPSAGSGVATPDLKTLIVAVPTRAELIYYDTLKLKEAKRAALDFQPEKLALQGKTLFASARGGSQVFALDLETGKQQKAFKVPGEPIADLACHHTKGLLYVSNTKEEIFTLDPKTGAVSKTDAKGLLLAVDPAAGAFVYAVSPEPDASGRSSVRKLAVKGKDLALAATNKNAALHARALHVSPDGKRLVVVGAGGFQPEGGAAKPASVAVLSTEDLVTTLGEIDVGSAPECVVFHPAIAAGAALGAEGDLVQLHARSLVQVKTTKTAPARSAKDVGWVVFASRGERVALWRPGDSSAKESGRLGFFPLELSAEERAALEKAFGPAPK